MAKTSVPYVSVNVWGEDVKIPVSKTQYAYYDMLFVKDKPSKNQKGDFTTLKGLMCAAYKYGIKIEKERHKQAVTESVKKLLRI